MADCGGNEVAFSFILQHSHSETNTFSSLFSSQFMNNKFCLHGPDPSSNKVGINLNNNKMQLLVYFVLDIYLTYYITKLFKRRCTSSCLSF